MNTIRKSGPIHFVPTEQRDTSIAHIVEYCVQVADRQPLTRSQAAWLVSDQQVSVDGRVVSKLSEKITLGTWEITIRGRKHHVVVHPAYFE